MYKHLFAVSSLGLGLWADRVVGGDEVRRAVGEVQARCHRRVVHVHWIRILIARVPVNQTTHIAATHRPLTSRKSLTDCSYTAPKL